MATLQITVEIADEPEVGHTRERIDKIDGSESGAILSRLASANRATFGKAIHNDRDVILKAIVAAVTAAEA